MAKSKWDETAEVLAHEMKLGARVVAVFKDLPDAEEAFDAVRRLCHPKADGFVSTQTLSFRKMNTMMIAECGEGSIRFTSERAQLRGYACDVFYLDGRATFRDWMAPLALEAKATFGVGAVDG